MFNDRARSLRPARLRARRRRALLVRGGIALAAVLALLGGSVWAARLPALAVSTVTVRGAVTVPVADIEQAVSRELAGAYLALYPKSNVLTLPTHEVASALLAAFPRIRSVDVSRSSRNALDITVDERTPYALWCGAKRSLSGGDPTGCYFLDDSGRVFTEAPDFSGDVFFRYFGPIEGDPINATFLAPGEFTELDLFVRSARDVGVKPVSLAVLDAPDAALHLSNGSKILFNRTGNLSDVLQNLKSVLESDVFRSQGGLALDYVDLRFGNKIFYKFK